MNATHDMMGDIVPNSPAQYCVFLHILFTTTKYKNVRIIGNLYDVYDMENQRCKK